MNLNHKTWRGLMMGMALTVASVGLPAWADDIHYPGKEWQSVAPASVGYDAKKLAAVKDYVEAGNAQGMHVSVGGQTILTAGDIKTANYVASVRKSVLAIMYGPYVADGTINLNASLSDIGLDDVGGLMPLEKTATVRDLISARSGIYHPASNSGDNSNLAPKRGSVKPGTYFLYNNWDFNAAGDSFELLTGKNIYAELNRQIVTPLGFQDFDLASHKRSGNPERSSHLAYHMNISARDLARVGVLMLAEGKWQDQQLVPKFWMREIVAPHTQADDMRPQSAKDNHFEYGYMWWLFDDDNVPAAYKGGYAARGHYGQYLVVLPAIDMVISLKTKPQRYKSPEEYDSIRISWEEMRKISDMLVATKIAE